MPLTFDMPLNQLHTYFGTNPRPDDFDEFWDNGVAELERLPQGVALETAEFQAPFATCRHLRFHGVGGAEIHAKYLTPKGASGPWPLVLMFHGYAIDSGDWFDKLPYVAAGYAVAAMDCRGQGGLSTDVGGVRGSTLEGHIVRGLADAPEKLLFRQIFLDTAMLARVLMARDEIDAERVYATGRSQGGGLTLACAALEPRIKKAAPVFPFLCDYQRVWEIDLAENAYRELRDFFRTSDPCHERRRDTFLKLGYIDVQFLCPRIQGDVFMGVALMDRICPPSTQFAAYNRISAPKSLAIYPDFEHEDLPGHPDKVFRFIVEGE